MYVHIFKHNQVIQGQIYSQTAFLAFNAVNNLFGASMFQICLELKLAVSNLFGA